MSAKVRKASEIDTNGKDEKPLVKKQKITTVHKPCNTLYIKNLNDKLNKKLLKEQLYILFSTYGEVIDVIVMKNAKMRGQLHVVFTSITDAKIAMRCLQNDVIFGKNMKIEWSKENSKIIERLS